MVNLQNTVITVNDAIDIANMFRNRINELEEQMLKINDFNRKVTARNSWRRRSGKTYGRWNK